MGKGLRAVLAAMLGLGLAVGTATGSYATGDSSSSSEESTTTVIVPALVPPAVPAVQSGYKTWSVAEYITEWERTNDRTMTPQELELLAEGCVGVTRVNVGPVYDPMGLSFGALDQAKEVQERLDDILGFRPTAAEYETAVTNDPVLGGLQNIREAFRQENGSYHQSPGIWKAVIFAKRFYSGQNPYWSDEFQDVMFRPNPYTGQVYMSAYAGLAKGGHLNYDFGYIDPVTDNVWHGNHGEPGMEIYQSTMDVYSEPRDDFDRQV
nr:hypothetical protein [Longispora sp. (in: high G+C Gram-positive bacteria)]